jgi:2-ketocyclohexanecarboxyl-CoA hydrolase
VLAFEQRQVKGSDRGEDMSYEDIIYDESKPGVAKIIFNRPKVMNAFRAKTCEEFLHALDRAGWDKSIGVIVLSGAGDKAFSTGADRSVHDGGYDGRGTIGLPIEAMHTIIRDVPKPVIAKVQGYAIGGGNVIATLADFTIASEKAIFGQVGPKVGSVDPGFGTAYLARIVGEKKAREIWYLCRQYTAQQALAMGLVNEVVPAESLDAEVDRWCDEILEKSPTAIALAKRSFNADTECIRGIGSLGAQALALYYGTDEAHEGAAAFKEKRKPDFRRAAKRAKI